VRSSFAPKASRHRILEQGCPQAFLPGGEAIIGDCQQAFDYVRMPVIGIEIWPAK
jgi:hypothetical protein